MQIVRIAVGLYVALLFGCLLANSQAQKMTVTGTLVRAMAIGGETTGWTIQLESEITAGGKQINSIEVDSHDVTKLEKFENKRVRATGTLSHRHGVETGDRPVLEISSLKEAKGKPASPAPGPGVAFSLTGSEWLLEDLAGGGVIDNVQATLAFPEEGKVSGNGSCNRFSGQVHINGDVIKFGPLATTRMACPEAVMNQETKYLNALQAAGRFEWKDPYLLLYCKGFEKPLRFTRKHD